VLNFTRHEPAPHLRDISKAWISRRQSQVLKLIKIKPTVKVRVVLSDHGLDLTIRAVVSDLC
jgi:hypothetical protein